MSQQPKSHDESEVKEPVKRRKRTAPWLLGGLVLFLLSVLVAQQLWLWTFIPPDTASDTLLLYALSSLNFVAFIVFAFIFVRNLLKLDSQGRGARPPTRLED
jgi:two-component system nitrogen regulation sensor histidine kinase NtrY